MDNDYYSIEAILAENQKLQCTFNIGVPDLGYLDGGNEKDASFRDQGRDKNAAAVLARANPFSPVSCTDPALRPHGESNPNVTDRDWVQVAIPAPYNARVRRALNADARSVKLSSLVGSTGTWYGFGKMIVYLLQEPQSGELATILTETFKARLIDVMDQAHHFGGGIGAGGEGVDGGAEFREGLEATERELFVLAQDSVRRTKQWHESNDRRGMRG